MKLQHLPRSTALFVAKKCCSLHSAYIPKTTQGNIKAKVSWEEFTSKLLDRRWSLGNEDMRIDQIKLSSKKVQHQDGQLHKRSWFSIANPSLGAEVMEKNCEDPSFYIVRGDLLHPLMNGNKARKLDAMLPLLEDYKITDVVTCGGCQSAHAAAVAVSCAERGLKSHLLLRGEQPDILTGYNLISTIYGNVTYIPRSIYANREDMLNSHANLVAGKCGEIVSWSDMIGAPFIKEIKVSSDFSQKAADRDPENCPRKVAIINEGAGDFAALLGVMRLVFHLAQNHLLGKDRTIKFVVDAGTGTTAVGLGLAVKCLGLPWEITAVMLADTIDTYRQQETRLMSDFKKHFGSHFECNLINLDGAVVHWVDRCQPRKFGNVMKGELEACQQIAQQTGILVDPIYTLAGWELATSLCEQEAGGGAAVAMLHTGGTLGMFGLAQRYKSYFQALKDS